MIKTFRCVTLACWGVMIAGNILSWLGCGVPNIVLNESALTSISLAEIMRSNNLF